MSKRTVRKHPRFKTKPWRTPKFHMAYRHDDPPGELLGFLPDSKKNHRTPARIPKSVRAAKAAISRANPIGNIKC